jgi:hypothetical protein
MIERPEFVVYLGDFEVASDLKTGQTIAVDVKDTWGAHGKAGAYYDIHSFCNSLLQLHNGNLDGQTLAFLHRVVPTRYRYTLQQHGGRLRDEDSFAITSSELLMQDDYFAPYRRTPEHKHSSFVASALSASCCSFPSSLLPPAPITAHVDSTKNKSKPRSSSLMTECQDLFTRQVVDDPLLALMFTTMIPRGEEFLLLPSSLSASSDAAATH